MSESDTSVQTESAMEQGSNGQASTAMRQLREQRAAAKPKKLPQYNVVLLNDDDHTYEYVIVMLLEIFAHPPQRGFAMAKKVDSEGRVIVLTTHKELAELKRDQIRGYGIDIRLATSRGSMGAVIEPVPE